MFRNHLFISFLFLCFYTAKTQDFYRMQGNKLYIYDLNTSCEGVEEFDFEGEFYYSELRFHPDGHLYIKSLSPDLHLYKYLYKFHPVQKKFVQIELNTAQPVTQIAISEEGRVILSHNNNNITEIYDYDLRQNEVIRVFDKDEIPGINPKHVGGILKDGYFLLPTMINSVDNYGMWNPETGDIKAFPVKLEENSDFLATSVLYSPCGDLSVYALVRKFNESWISWGDTISNSMRSLCEMGSIVPVVGANPTDFRQSPLRIHLDHDQSSGHMTGGYYDTLTTCRKEVPIADDDIELFTCEATVDSISFRLRYYDQPRLAEEYLTAEGSESGFRQTSPSRWVWENPYGGDEEQIKDFLRSVRYHADWDPEDAEQSRERVVMTTMYVDGDSTTSWTVYQLEKEEEIYAGRDTVVTYCAEDESLDLADYLSTGASRDGRIDPALSAEGMIFTPGVDEDTTYLYIVEEGECADTAELQVVPFVAENIHLDTVFLCPGERVMVGFPVDQYEVTWWDGSRGDSIWVTPADAGSRRVSIQFDDCGIQAEMEIIVQDLSGQAGEDKVIPYCVDGGPFSLTEFLPAPEDFTPRLEPALHTEDLTFTPGMDSPGEYQYILTPSGPEAGCPDTALITLEESAAGEIVLESVRICTGSEVKIGLPAGLYQNIRWWNGDTGDSTLVTGDDAGDLWVEAERDGCTYHGSFTAEVLPAPEFPGYFPEQLALCAGEESRISVEELDSVWWEGRVYQEGEELVFTEKGDFTLTGYRDDCAAEKEISVEVISDPAADYHFQTELCEGEETEIRLPDR